MTSGKTSSGRSLAVTAVIYLIQTAVVLLVVFHDFSSKDTVIVISSLIAMYGMITAQASLESAISGMHFVTLARLIAHSKDTHQAGDWEVDLEELTRKDTPFTLAHGLFGFLIAFIGAAKLVYTLLT